MAANTTQGSQLRTLSRGSHDVEPGKDGAGKETAAKTGADRLLPENMNDLLKYQVAAGKT